MPNYNLLQYQKQAALDKLDRCTCGNSLDWDCPEHGYLPEYDDCGCVLPSQSCEVCRAKAAEIYNEWELD